jgi:hypothetical protein
VDLLFFVEEEVVEVIFREDSLDLGVTEEVEMEAQIAVQALLPLDLLAQQTQVEVGVAHIMAIQILLEEMAEKELSLYVTLTQSQ